MSECDQDGRALEGLVALSKMPVPPELPAIARPLADRAVLKLRNFREDLERIQSSAIRAKDDGTLSGLHATMIWVDHGDVVSLPLIERYVAARKFAELAAWLRSRDAIQMMDWPDPRARAALDAMVAHGEGALAASLCRHHIDRMIRKLRQDWKERRRGQPKKLSEEIRAAIRATQAAIVAHIPTRNTELLLDIAAVEPIVAAHGSAEDIAFVAAVKAEVEADRDCFPAAA